MRECVCVIRATHSGHATVEHHDHGQVEEIEQCKQHLGHRHTLSPASHIVEHRVDIDKSSRITVGRNKHLLRSGIGIICRQVKVFCVAFALLMLLCLCGFLFSACFVFYHARAV